LASIVYKKEWNGELTQISPWLNHN
jgi:hypothetical protein